MSPNACRAPRSIIVAGQGLVAKLAALALRRALPRTDVTIVAHPHEKLSLSDLFPVAAAPVHELLESLGFAEQTLVASGAAIHRLGDRFSGWNGTSFTVSAIDEDGLLPGVPMHQLWLTHGRSTPFDALTVAAALIAAGRFDPELLARAARSNTIDPALALDPEMLGSQLDARLAAAGVGLRQARIANVQLTPAGCITSLDLDGQGAVAADLFVDASGPARTLSAGSFMSWRDELPVTRLLYSRMPATLALASSYEASRSGWRANLPEPRHDVSAFALHDGAECAADAEQSLPITPGRLHKFFDGNVVAIGEAATEVGPLGCMGFSLALRHLALLLELLPPIPLQPLLAAEYNRRAGQIADNARDFVMLPDSINRWRYEHDVPASRTITEFSRRGSLPYRGEDLSLDLTWIQMLVGLGVTPPDGGHVANSVSPANARELLSQRRAWARSLAAAMPPYPSWWNLQLPRAPLRIPH